VNSPEANAKPCGVQRVQTRVCRQQVKRGKSVRGTQTPEQRFLQKSTSFRRERDKKVRVRVKIVQIMRGKRTTNDYLRRWRRDEEANGRNVRQLIEATCRPSRRHRSFAKCHAVTDVSVRRHREFVRYHGIYSIGNTRCQPPARPSVGVCGRQNSRKPRRVVCGSAAARSAQRAVRACAPYARRARSGVVYAVRV